MNGSHVLYTMNFLIYDFVQTLVLFHSFLPFFLYFYFNLNANFTTLRIFIWILSFDELSFEFDLLFECHLNFIYLF